MEAISVDELEAMCNQCGVCCHAGIPTEDGHQLIVKGLKCKFLLQKGDKQICSVYEDRFEKAPWCLTLMKGFEYQVFPSDGRCNYVKSSSYKGKITLSDDEYTQLEPQIAKSFLEKGKPPWCSNRDWGKFVDRANDLIMKKSFDVDSLDTTTPFDKMGFAEKSTSSRGNSSED